MPGQSKILVFVALAIILGVPFLMKPPTPESAGEEDVRTLIVVTPHVQQIRSEFARAFDAWHRREHGEGVRMDFRTPGGTSEIIKQLQAQYTAAVRAGAVEATPDGGFLMEPGTIGFDLMFGGGSYDHGRLKRSGPRIDGPEGEQVTLPMSIPVGFDQAFLDDRFGENAIGAQELYDPDQYWIGTALSSFGIVYNRDLFEEKGLAEPNSFEDLTDPGLAGWVALADPRQSGSITTTFDSILSNYGWERGWRTLRAMSANTRYFTASSTKPPIDVSQGEAAAGLAIDFYGRGQAQSVLAEGEEPGSGRVGYADPAGSVYIDADPVSVLRGGPDPELARRFVRFCLTDEAQALWQFRAGVRDNPPGPDGEPMGPRVHELRRLPVRRAMYDAYGQFFVDQGVFPFEIASETTPAGWRSSIGVMMGAFAIDTADHQRAAWRAIRRARAEDGFPRDVLEEMEDAFFAFPEHEMPDGTVLSFVPENYRAIRNSWRDPDYPDWGRLSETRYARFFRDQYRRVVELSATHASAR
ncbi:MAG: extracellular solute-binding protein [Planctomycetota bacterium]